MWLLAACSAIEGVLLMWASDTNSLYMCYFMYIAFGALHNFMITAARWVDTLFFVFYSANFTVDLWSDLILFFLLILHIYRVWNLIFVFPSNEQRNSGKAPERRQFRSHFWHQHTGGIAVPVAADVCGYCRPIASHSCSISCVQLLLLLPGRFLWHHRHYQFDICTKETNRCLREYFLFSFFSLVCVLVVCAWKRLIDIFVL